MAQWAAQARAIEYNTPVEIGVVLVMRTTGSAVQVQGRCMVDVVGWPTPRGWIRREYLHPSSAQTSGETGLLRVRSLYRTRI